MSKVHHLLTIKKGNPISLIGFPLHFKTQTLFQSFGDKSLQFLSSQIFSYNTIIFIQHEDRRNSINIVRLRNLWPMTAGTVRSGTTRCTPTRRNIRV